MDILEGASELHGADIDIELQELEKCRLKGSRLDLDGARHVSMCGTMRVAEAARRPLR